MLLICHPGAWYDCVRCRCCYSISPVHMTHDTLFAFSAQVKVPTAGVYRENSGECGGIKQVPRGSAVIPFSLCLDSRHSAHTGVSTPLHTTTPLSLQPSGATSTIQALVLFLSVCVTTRVAYPRFMFTASRGQSAAAREQQDTRNEDFRRTSTTVLPCDTDLCEGGG